MPQIAQLPEIWSSQLFWLLVIFGLVFVVVGRGMVPKVMDTVAMRDKQIAGDLAAAQAARDQADAEEEAWRKRQNEQRAEAQALIAEAKAAAAATTEKKLAAAQKRIDKQLGDAEVRIDEARAGALSEIESVAAEAAQDIVARLAGVQVHQTKASSAVRKALANV